MARQAEVQARQAAEAAAATPEVKIAVSTACKDTLARRKALDQKRAEDRTGAAEGRMESRARRGWLKRRPNVISNLDRVSIPR